MNQQQQHNVRDPRTAAMAHVALACAIPFPTDPHVSIDVMDLKVNAWYRNQLVVIERALGDGWPDRRQWVERVLRREAEVRLADMGWRLK